MRGREAARRLTRKLEAAEWRRERRGGEEEGEGEGEGDGSARRGGGVMTWARRGRRSGAAR